MDEQRRARGEREKETNKEEFIEHREARRMRETEGEGAGER